MHQCQFVSGMEIRVSGWWQVWDWVGILVPSLEQDGKIAVEHGLVQDTGFKLPEAHLHQKCREAPLFEVLA